MPAYQLLTLIEPHNSKIVKFERKHKRLMRFLEPLAAVMDRFIEKKLHHNLDRLETLAHPQEDYLETSSRFPIFAVADGVTLEMNPDGTYPNPSGAGEAARLFCTHAICEAEKRYKEFSQDDLSETFLAGNKAVGAYNNSQGRVRNKLNYWNIDLFAATVTFGILKENKFYWASLCDCYVAHYDSDMRPKFRSPECWPAERRCFPPDWEQRPEDERKKEIRRMYRNGVQSDGQMCGYGVATGEANAEKYLNTGVLELSQGDRVFLYSDGFEQYFNLPQFLDIFRLWPDNLQEQIEALTAAKSREDGANFGHERTIIALKIN
jgi:hypothetical protein